MEDLSMTLQNALAAEDEKAIDSAARIVLEAYSALEKSIEASHQYLMSAIGIREAFRASDLTKPETLRRLHHLEGMLWAWLVMNGQLRSNEPITIDHHKQIRQHFGFSITDLARRAART